MESFYRYPILFVTFTILASGSALAGLEGSRAFTSEITPGVATAINSGTIFIDNDEIKCVEVDQKKSVWMFSSEKDPYNFYYYDNGKWNFALTKDESESLAHNFANFKPKQSTLDQEIESQKKLIKRKPDLLNLSNQPSPLVVSSKELEEIRKSAIAQQKEAFLRKMLSRYQERVIEAIQKDPAGQKPVDTRSIARIVVANESTKAKLAVVEIQPAVGPNCPPLHLVDVNNSQRRLIFTRVSEPSSGSLARSLVKNTMTVTYLPSNISMSSEWTRGLTKGLGESPAKVDLSPPVDWRKLTPIRTH